MSITPRSPMSTPRNGFAAGLDSLGRIYAFGGAVNVSNTPVATNKSLERYDPVTDSWIQLTPASFWRATFAWMIDPNDRFLYAGGLAPNTIITSGRSEGEIYDPLTNIWSSIPPMPVVQYIAAGISGNGDQTQGRNNCYFWPANDQLYISGGTTTSLVGSVLGTHTMHDVLKYTGGSAGSWSQPWSTAFDIDFTATGTGYNNRVSTRSSKPTLSQVLLDSQNRFVRIWESFSSSPKNINARYDPASNTWTSLNSIPPGRQSHAIVMDPVTDKIYAVNGFLVGSSLMLNTGQVYDPSTNSWTNIANAPLATAGSLGVFYRGSFYLIGGLLSTGAATDIIWQYNPITDSWCDTLDRLTRPKQVPISVFDGAGFYLIGGSTSSQVFADVEYWIPSPCSGVVSSLIFPQVIG